jgi:hypothetical protein
MEIVLLLSCPFRALVCFHLDYKPKVMPWADMTWAFSPRIGNKTKLTIRYSINPAYIPHPSEFHPPGNTPGAGTIQKEAPYSEPE